MRRPVIGSLLLVCSFAADARAQDVGERLRSLANANAEAYVGPLARGLGHALTAGSVWSADPHEAFGFSIGLRVVGALFPDNDERFPVVLPSNVTYEHPLLGPRTYTNPYMVFGAGTSPTVSGSGAGALLVPTGQFQADLLLGGENATDHEIRFPQGAGLAIAPLAVIEVAVGIGFGTQLTARMAPTVDAGAIADADGLGDVSVFGIGVMHEVTHWLPFPSPNVDVALTASTQKIELGNYLEGSASAFGLVASVGVGPLSAYAHASTYRARFEFDYTIENPAGTPGLPGAGTVIRLEQEVARTSRLAVGAELDLILLKLSAEYGMGDYRTVSGRVAFGSR